MLYTVRIICVSLFLFFIHCSSTFAREDLGVWFSENLDQAVSTIPKWQVNKPVFRLVESNYVEVLQNGDMNVGKSLLRKVKAAQNSNDLVQILLLHELRHIYQINKKNSKDRNLLECDSDYFATLQYARSLLKDAPEEMTPDTLVRVLQLQSVGAQLNALSDRVVQHTHLSSSQRFSISVFAVWRAIHEKLLVSKKESDVRYAELAQRAKGFVEPITNSDEVWSSDFCGAIVSGPASEKKWITFRDETDVTNMGSGLYFDRQTRISNSFDRPLRVMAWPLNGMHKKQEPENYEKYFGQHAGFIDVMVPALGSSIVSWRQMLPGEIPGEFELFTWESTANPQFIIKTSVSGPRAEPPNCNANWIPPKDRHLAELFDFLKRAGTVAARGFAGLRGDEMFSETPLPFLGTTYYFWAGLPKIAKLEDSYIVVSSDSAPFGSVTLFKSTSLPEIEAEFDRQSAAFRQSCAAQGVRMEEQKKHDGTRRFSVDRLTIFSNAALYLNKKKEKNEDSVKPAEYSLDWIVRPEN